MRQSRREDGRAHAGLRSASRGALQFRAIPPMTTMMKRSIDSENTWDLEAHFQWCGHRRHGAAGLLDLLARRMGPPSVQGGPRHPRTWTPAGLLGPGAFGAVRRVVPAGGRPSVYRRLLLVAERSFRRRPHGRLGRRVAQQRLRLHLRRHPDDAASRGRRRLRPGHDWRNILRRLGLLEHTDAIAYTVRWLSALLFAAAAGLAVWWWVQARTDRSKGGEGAAPRRSWI